MNIEHDIGAGQQGTTVALTVDLYIDLHIECTFTCYELCFKNHTTTALRIANKIVKTDTFNSACKTFDCTKINLVRERVPHVYNTFGEKIMSDTRA